MSKGEVEAAFDRALRCYNLGPWVRNHRPFEGDRREIDFAWPEFLVGVEVQEETAHGHWKKQSQDAAKSNDLQLMGWVILHFTGTMIRNDPAGCVEKVREAFAHTRWGTRD